MSSCPHCAHDVITTRPWLWPYTIHKKVCSYTAWHAVASMLGFYSKHTLFGTSKKLYFFLCVSRQLHEGLEGYGGFEKALDREIWFDMLCWDWRALFISLCYKMCFSSERAHAETSTDGIINKELSHLILCNMLYLFVKSAYCVAFFKPRFSSSIFSNLKSSSLISHSSLLTAIMKRSV